MDSRDDRAMVYVAALVMLGLVMIAAVLMAGV